MISNKALGIITAVTGILLGIYIGGYLMMIHPLVIICTQYTIRSLPGDVIISALFGLLMGPVVLGIITSFSLGIGRMIYNERF